MGISVKTMVWTFTDYAIKDLTIFLGDKTISLLNILIGFEVDVHF